MSYVAGAIMVIGGMSGIVYTYTSIRAENVTTPEDATIPSTSVRGPLTLKAQADAIRTHMLKTSGGKTYAELPRTVPKLDTNGNPVLDEEGNAVQVPNTVRETWITATTLMTALKLGMLAYAFSAFALILGILFLMQGLVLGMLRRNVYAERPAMGRTCGCAH